jgi:hypothetical protein
MVARQITSGRLKSALGIGVLALGILVFLPRFNMVAPHFGDTLDDLTMDLYNALPSIGLGVLHAGQALVFDPISFFAGALQILVSFWPLILIFLGTALVRRASIPRFAASEADAGSQGNGERS